jgi:hypothetical protein
MIDFSKRLNRTPEQRAADLTDARARHLDGIKHTISARSQKIGDLMDRLSVIPESHHRFINDLNRKAETLGVGADLVGLDILDLTSKQLQYLDSLHLKYAVSPPSPRP